MIYEESKNILIAESQTLYAEVLSWHLSQNGYFVQRAEDFNTALEMAGRTSYDLIIIDLLLHGLYGPISIKELKKQFPDVPVMVLTSAVNFRVVQNLLEIGVNACLSKMYSVKNFPAIIELVMAGETYVNFEIALTEGDDRQHLSESELAVLRKLMLGQSNVEISDEIGMNLNTVKYNIGRLLKRFHVKSRSELISNLQRDDFFI